MNAADYLKTLEEEDISEGRAGIYLAGPIDLVKDNPDGRHDLLASVLERVYEDDTKRPTIYCPYCVQVVYQSAPAVAISRNLRSLEQSDAFIAVWAGVQFTPSFGTPVELYLAASFMPDKTLVVGTMGVGLFADAIRARGVREVLSLDVAVELLRL